LPRYARDNGSVHDDDFTHRFQPETGFNQEVRETATAHIDNSSSKPATPATEVKMASRILKTAAEAITDAGKSKSVAIEEGLYPAD